MLVLAIYFPWRDLNRQARLTGVTLVFFCALWILSHAIEIGLPVATVKESMVGLQLVLGILALTFWLFYILHYLGPRKLLAWRIYILFSIMPIIAILALSINNVYGLMWTEAGLDSQNPYLPLQPTYGLIYWACMVYMAVLTLTGSFLIIWNILRHRYIRSRESIFLLIAAVLPMVTAFIEVMGLLTFLKLSVGLSSWTACIGAIILILNLPRLHPEQVTPIARDIIFERIEDCILVLDMQNRVLDLNPAAEQLIGHKISDALGLSIERIWPYLSTPMTSFNKLANPGDELVLERDGKQRTYALRISTITDSGGSLTSKVVLLTDITKRKQSEEALKASEAQYRLLSEHTTDTVWLMDMNLNFVYNSPSVEKLRGFTAQEIMEMPWQQHITPKSLKLATEVISREIPRVLDEPDYNPILSLELEYTCKDGTTVWAESKFSIIRDESGKPVSILGEARDITERKQAAKAIEKQREEYRTIYDSARPAIIYLNKEGVVQRINKSGAASYGLKPKDMVGKTAYDFYPAAEADEYAAANNEVMNSGKASLGVIQEYSTPTGKKRWAQIDRIPFFNENGDITGVITFLQDVSKQKLAEEKLTKSYESLKKTLDDAIDTMAKIVETRDPYTSGHQHKVADLAIAIAREMKLEDTRIDQLRMAAVIHDIGKLYVPFDILSKPGRLTDIEFKLIKTHPQSGYDIVKGMDFPCNVAEAVLQHHERLDGSGYPNQLKGDDTLLEAKILAVADVIEAMAAHRPYRPALGIDKALEEISKNKDSLYDPNVVDACVKLFKSGRFEFNPV